MFTMSCLKDYRDRVRLLSKKEISDERRNLFFMLNGDVFFPVKSWPLDVRRIFWRKPIGDTDCFKLMQFCLGNRCPPDFVVKWILSSQTWAPEKTATA